VNNCIHPDTFPKRYAPKIFVIIVEITTVILYKNVIAKRYAPKIFVIMVEITLSSSIKMLLLMVCGSRFITATNHKFKDVGTCSI
jgi:hypothetical protein